MRIEIAKIEHQTLAGNYDLQSRSWESDGNRYVLHDCTVSYQIYRISETDYHLTERYEGKLDLSCTACLQPFYMDVAEEFSVLLTTLSRGQEDNGTEEGLGDEAEPVEGDHIELDRYVVDTVQLNLPMSHLCSPDCKGMCANCGADLNDGPCDCKVEHRDPRWNALESLLDKKE